MAVTITKKFWNSTDSKYDNISKIVFTSPNIDSPAAAGTRSHILPGSEYIGTWYESIDHMYRIKSNQSEPDDPETYFDELILWDDSYDFSNDYSMNIGVDYIGNDLYSGQVIHYNRNNYGVVSAFQTLTSGVPIYVQPDITVLVPSGIMDWRREVSNIIYWNVEGLYTSDYVNIELSRNDGSTWETLASGIPNTGFYETTITGVDTSQAKISVSGVYTAAEDISDTFDIISGDVDILYPSSGSHWRNESPVTGGQPHNIWWNSEDFYNTDYVNIELSRNDGSTWETLASGIPNTGFYETTITGVDTSQAKISVSGVYTAAEDISDTFDIEVPTGSFTFLYPTGSGNEQYDAKGSHKVWWTCSTDKVYTNDTVVIQSSIDGGPFTTVYSGSNNNGYQEIALSPDKYTDIAQIKIFMADYPSISGTSNQFKHGHMDILKPDINTKWRSSEGGYMWWSSWGFINNINLIFDISADNGSTYTSYGGINNLGSDLIEQSPYNVSTYSNDQMKLKLFYDGTEWESDTFEIVPSVELLTGPGVVAQIDGPACIDSTGTYIYRISNNSNLVGKGTVATGAWEVLTETPEHINSDGYASMAMVGDYLYLIKGDGEIFWEYDINADNWKALESIPISVNNFTYIANLDGDNYLFFSCLENGGVYRYNITTDDWNKEYDVPMEGDVGDNRIFYAHFGPLLYKHPVTGHHCTIRFIWSNPFDSLEVVEYDLTDHAVLNDTNPTNDFPISISVSSCSSVSCALQSSPICTGAISSDGLLVAMSFDTPAEGKESHFARNQFTVSGTNDWNCWSQIAQYQTDDLGFDVDFFDHYSSQGFFASTSSPTILATTTSGVFYIYPKTSNTVSNSYIYNFASTVASGTETCKCNTIFGAEFNTRAPYLDYGSDILYLNNKIYITPGGASTGIYAYDISGDSWSRISNSIIKGTGECNPESTYGNFAAIITDEIDIYQFMGFDSARFYKYEVTTSGWSNKADAPGPIKDYANIVYDGSTYFYAIQGKDSQAFWRYNIAGDSWDTLEDAPEAFYEKPSVHYPGSGDYIYAIHDKYGGEVSRYESFWRYSISGDIWTVASGSFPTTFENPIWGLTSSGTKLYIITERQNTWYDVYEYDINNTGFDNANWVKMAHNIIEKANFSNFVCDSSAYIYLWSENGLYYSSLANLGIDLDTDPGVVLAPGSISSLEPDGWVMPSSSPDESQPSSWVVPSSLPYVSVPYNWIAPESSPQYNYVPYTHQITFSSINGSEVLNKDDKLYTWSRDISGVWANAKETVIFEITNGEAYNCRLTAWDDDTHTTTNNKILDERHYKVVAAAYRAGGGTKQLPLPFTTDIDNVGLLVYPPAIDISLKGNTVSGSINNYYGDFDLLYAANGGESGNDHGDYLVFIPRLYDMNDSFSTGNYDFVTTLHYQYT